jgi:hypothetical protein
MLTVLFKSCTHNNSIFYNYIRCHEEQEKKRLYAMIFSVNRIFVDDTKKF